MAQGMVVGKPGDRVKVGRHHPIVVVALHDRQQRLQPVAIARLLKHRLGHQRQHRRLGSIEHVGVVVLALVEQVLDQAFGQGKPLIILRIKDNLFLGTSKNLDFPENVNVISRISVSQDPPKGN